MKISKRYIIYSCFVLILCSCKNKLEGTYVVDKLKSDTSIPDKMIEQVVLKKNKTVELYYKDTVIIARWKEVDIQENHYIEIYANKDIYELMIYEDSTIHLYFINHPTNFRGDFYDSLEFKRAENK